METEEIDRSIFDDVESTSSLFDDVSDDISNEVETTDEIKEDSSLFSTVDEDEEEPSDTSKKKQTQVKSNQDTTIYSEGVSALVEGIEEFGIWEGDEDKTDWSKSDFVELVAANIETKVEKNTNAILNHIVESFSPAIQKIIKAELKGVKVKDIIADIQEYEEIESIPANPSNTEKETIVRKYYKELAKEKNRDNEWVNRQVEKIIDREEIDDEFVDAKDFFEKKIDEKVKKKEEENNKKKQERDLFKQKHTKIVNEVLSEEVIFGIKLSKAEKDAAANVLAGFAVRNSDGKEKLGLTALVDDLINSDDPKESYKKLILMSLMGIAPDKVIEKLKTSANTEVTKATVRQLKTANTSTTALSQKKTNQKQGNKSIFD